MQRVLLEQLVPRERLVRRELMELQAQLVRQELMGQLVPQALLVPMVR